jgi:hypothetical protein
VSAPAAAPTPRSSVLLSAQIEEKKSKIARLQKENAELSQFLTRLRAPSVCIEGGMAFKSAERMQDRRRVAAFEKLER